MGNIDFGDGITPFSDDTPTYGIVMNDIIMDDWTRQLAMMEAYDQTYSIFDHEAHANDDPLSIIGMHPAEDYVTDGSIEVLMRELMAYRIPELTNTSLLDLMQLPRYRLDILLKDGRKAVEKESNDIDILQAELNK